MDVIADDQALQAIFARDLGIDNEGSTIDFKQLDDYLTNDNLGFLDDPIGSVVGIDNPHHAMETPSPSLRMTSQPLRMTSQLLPQPDIHTISQSHLQGVPQQINMLAQGRLSHMNNNMGPQMTELPGCAMEHFKTFPYITTPLPESPPYSGSEHAYSPPDVVISGLENQSVDMASLPQPHPAHHPPPQMYPQSRPSNMPPTSKGYGVYEPPKLNHLPSPPSQGMLPQGIMPPQYNVLPQMPPQSNKKRKYSDSPTNTINANILNGMTGSMVKQEPPAYVPGYLPDCSEDEYSQYDVGEGSAGFDGSYQMLKWQAYQPNKWAVLCDANYKDLPAPSYRVDADKGFNISQSDDSFVCQKKNHFQVTVHVGIAGHPKFVKTQNDGIKHIDSYHVHFHGAKMESPNQLIRVEQSQSDRSKKAFYPVKMDLVPDQVKKITVGRLHFSETTTNNMRKKGKPNPDQRYFILIISLNAHCGDENFVIASHVSEKIIVRASNPGQFDSDVDVMWQKGHTPDSVFHIGRVGVNTDHPEEALTIHGNLKLTGHIVQPSDIRAKEDLQELDPRVQLRNVSQMKIYKYGYREDYAESAGLSKQELIDTGVIAQEIMDVLPDAVLDTGDVYIGENNLIENFLVVNKDRIYMENVGAVKELCKLTDNLENRIDELEIMNKKLAKLKRYDSLKSTVSGKSLTCSLYSGTDSAISSVSQQKPQHHRPHHPHHHHRHNCPHSQNNNNTRRDKQTPYGQPVSPVRTMCSSRFIQITIIILILIMAFCLVSITVLYILEKHKTSDDSGLPNVHNNGTLNSETAHLNDHTPHLSIADVTPVAQQPELSYPPTIAPTIHPDRYVMPVAGCVPVDGHQECEEVCCNLLSNDQPSTDWEENRTGFHVTHGPDRSMQRTMTAKHDGETYNVHTGMPVVQVVIHKDNWKPFNPSSGATYVDKTADNNADNDNNGQDQGYGHVDSNSVYRGKRMAENPISISLPEVNYDIRDDLCLPHACSRHNYTYTIPIKKSVPLNLNVTIHFVVTAEYKVFACHQDVESVCEPRDEASVGVVANFQSGVPQTDWLYPIGRYREALLKFRASKFMNNPCNTTSTGQDEFIEYNLKFMRKCN